MTFNKSSDAKIVEYLRAVFPWIGITILSNGLIIETVNGRDLSRLMVSSQQCDMLWVPHLQT